MPKLGETPNSIIEIDESKFIKTKNACNHKARGTKFEGWVVGMIDRETKCKRVCVVKTRDADTLLDVC